MRTVRGCTRVVEGGKFMRIAGRIIGRWDFEIDDLYYT